MVTQVSLRPGGRTNPRTGKQKRGEVTREQDREGPDRRETPASIHWHHCGPLSEALDPPVAPWAPHMIAHSVSCVCVHGRVTHTGLTSDPTDLMTSLVVEGPLPPAASSWNVLTRQRSDLHCLTRPHLHRYSFFHYHLVHFQPEVSHK